MRVSGARPTDNFNPTAAEGRGTGTSLSSMDEHYTEDHDISDQTRDYRPGINVQPPHIPPILSYDDRSAATMGTPPTGRESRPGFFNNSQETESVSPSEAMGALGDYSRESDSGYLPRFGGPSNAPMMLNPKRAYRQRRKDPSCDACRERKVKCDATDTTSCTECSSRNVRCQFTKDTNRRMSSIKQVQDLEKQLQEVRLQLERYRSSEPHTEQSSPPGAGAFDCFPDIADISRSPRRMLKARPPYDLSNTRMQLADVGRGLFQPLIVPLTKGYLSNPVSHSLPLPPEDTARDYLNTYFECVHRRLPIFFWPEFCGNSWSLYLRDPDQGPATETISLFFAVLALGALFSPEPEARNAADHLIRIATSHIDTFTQTASIDHGLARFVISMYFMEINQKSVAWLWLGNAVQIIQDKGLHMSGGQWPRTDGEIRKRIWYSFYASERLLSLEISRPMLINDDDCDAEYPESLKEEETVPDVFHPQRPTILQATIYIARLMQPLAQLCRSLCIPIDAVRTFEMHMGACIQMFPQELQLDRKTPLDPLVMAPLIYFQNTRIILHRHNLSPACSAEQRSLAIKNCSTAAEDTATIISRCFDMQAPVERMQTRLKMAATNLVCTHAWRCLLFLSFCQLWGSFYIILRFVSIVADGRVVNVSCGRHLRHFLDLLIQRYKQDTGYKIEEDAELIVLLSGDLQGGPNGWLWNHKDATAPVIQRQGSTNQFSSNAKYGEYSQQPEALPSWESPITENEKKRWGGWEKVSQAAQYLERLQMTRQSHTTLQFNPLRSNPESRTASLPTDSDRSMSTPKSRMTIASITDQST